MNSPPRERFFTRADFDHFILRLLASILITHIILVYGEEKSSYELLVDPAYWAAVPGSLLIAYLIIEIVYRISAFLNVRLPLKTNILHRTGVQFLFGFLPVSLTAFLLAAVYFFSRGKNILKTTYIHYDLPFIMALIFCLNLLYVIYYHFLKESKGGIIEVIGTEITDHELIDVPAEIKISKAITVPVDQIRYIFHSNDCNFIVADGNLNPLACNESLDYLESQLPKDLFFRINRWAIVNYNAIVTANLVGRQFELELDPPIKGEQYNRVSQKNTSAFKIWNQK